MNYFGAGEGFCGDADHYADHDANQGGAAVEDLSTSKMIAKNQLLGAVLELFVVGDRVAQLRSKHIRNMRSGLEHHCDDCNHLVLGEWTLGKLNILVDMPVITHMRAATALMAAV
jgi:hypothetical protein